MSRHHDTKAPYNLNKLAAFIVDKTTNEEPITADDDGKNPAAVTLGRLGGAKGGPARAKALRAEQRSEIAKKAAAARWGNKENDNN